MNELTRALKGNQSYLQVVFGDVRCANWKAMMWTLLLSVRLKDNLKNTQNALKG